MGVETDAEEFELVSFLNADNKEDYIPDGPSAPPLATQPAGRVMSLIVGGIGLLADSCAQPPSPAPPLSAATAATSCPRAQAGCAESRRACGRKSRYDLMVVNLVRSQLAELYPVGGDFSLSWQASLLTSSSLLGALVGQLALGYAADRLGRRSAPPRPCLAPTPSLRRGGTPRPPRGRQLLLISGGLTTAGCLGSALALDDGRPGHRTCRPSLGPARGSHGCGRRALSGFECGFESRCRL